MCASKTSRHVFRYLKRAKGNGRKHSLSANLPPLKKRGQDILREEVSMQQNEKLLAFRDVVVSKQTPRETASQVVEFDSWAPCGDPSREESRSHVSRVLSANALESTFSR